MKLNEQQREVIQALLDDRNVKVNLDSGPFWSDLEFHHFAHLGDGETEYIIEEPAVKVALFKWNDRLCCFTFKELQDAEVDVSQSDFRGWVRISEWVDIAPNKVLK